MIASVTVTLIVTVMKQIPWSKYPMLGGRDLVVKGHHIHVRAHFQRGHPFSMYTNRGEGGG